MNTKKQQPHGQEMVHGAHLDAQEEGGVLKQVRDLRKKAPKVQVKATGTVRWPEGPPNALKAGILLLTCVILVGCQNQNVVDSADRYLTLTSEEYLGYVDADPTLEDGSKAIRRSYVESFRRVIEAAKE